MEGHKRLNLGKKGEEKAEKFLKRKGYRILERNFRIKGGEIDIVAEKGGEIVFVEVRTRSSDDFMSPVESLTPAKREKLRRAAEVFLISRGLELNPCRFDFVSIVKDGSRYKIEHLENVYI